MTERDIVSQIHKLVELYFSQQSKTFVPNQTTIHIASPSYGFEEVNEAIDSLLSTWVTMGDKVKQFEEAFAKYIGVKYAVMVNSGSSANLLALSVLTNPAIQNKLNQGDEVITPALTWVTTVYPIFNNGLKPVFVDVDLKSLNIDVNQIERAITPKTKAIMPVHLLGNPANMKKIMEIAKKNDLLVIEDACEAHGAKFNGEKVGSFGNISTFSFFLSHHITTIEGGMLLTNNEEYYELAKALRAFGWIRELKNKDVISKKNPEIDPRFLFVNVGYNIRPTELQGAFGIHQIKKLENFIEIRRQNARYWNDRLSKYEQFFILPKTDVQNHVFFGYALTIKNNAPFSRNQLTKFLESKKIETRPIMAGNFTEQPVAELLNWKKIGELKNSRLIMRNSFFIGNHQKIGAKEREYVADVIDEFIEKTL